MYEKFQPSQARLVSRRGKRRSCARTRYRIRLECPEIAGRIVPGQFLMLRLESGNDPLLGRPFALYDVIRDEQGAPRWIDIVYLTIGKMTKRLALVLAGDTVGYLGAAGQRFSARGDRSSADGGRRYRPNSVRGLGQGISGPRTIRRCSAEKALRAASARAKKVTLCYGAKTAAFLAGMEDFRKCGVQVRLSTDDGIRRPSRAGHGVDRTGRRVGERFVPDRLLRTGADARRGVEARRPS